ncbi:MAG: TonB-dependent receptor [Sphingomonas sp.]|uniref:TonB-dependent receptor domain-containing protein n=1 Tax=Sphingomonas sp. TaxID=28214 RepID=UPI001AC12D85|nr:TonB-dependent receptor [Sphingomonas sp.]MBN8816233.1 TonB-dependent receptor [Sphingomonas sp.]
MRYVSTVALAASVALCPQAALARDTVYQVNIGAIDLADALATLSAQTGISVATDGPIPRERSAAVQGRMSAREALDRMLRASDLRAIRVGATTYRIVRRKHPSSSAGQPKADPEAEAGPDIVITARKQSEELSKIAAPVAVYQPEEKDGPGVRKDSHSVANDTDGLALTNLGPGRDRLFIRGIADSPFNGFSQSTVSVQIDDGRVTYDAPDPGLRLVDVARVEVLKGPQGPLYGTGALGGVYRIVTNRPVLGVTSGGGGFGFSAVSRGGLGGEGEAVLNLPLVNDLVAVRFLAYAAADGGWINDADGSRNLNRSITYGGRAMLRIAPADGWTIDLSGLFQSIGVRDSQYVDRAARDLTRDLSILEPRASRVRMAQATVTGPVGSLQLTAATSYTWQDQDDLFDATASAAALGVTGPASYRDYRVYHLLDQEVRLSSSSDANLSWLVGASYLAAVTRATGDISSGGQPAFPFFALHRIVTEAALFADGSVDLSPQWRLAAGIRLFRSTTDDERLEQISQSARSKSLIGVTPSASLSYQFTPDRSVYVRVGTAFRPGGIDPTNPATGRYDADQLTSIDIGTRLRLDRGRLSLDGGFFASNWQDIQSDYLEPTGLIATRNAGKATNVGVEASADWRRGGWRMKAGFTWQRPRLVSATDGTDLPPDRRLPVVPDITGRVRLSRDIAVGGWRITPQIAADLVGASRLSFDAGLDRRVPDYVVARAGIAADRDGLVVRFDIDNLLDGRADTFAFGNPFSVGVVRQYTPLRPRTYSLSVSRRF